MDGAATILVNDDGTYADASPAALELLGVTLDELLASPPGRFSAEPANAAANAAFRQQWARAGSPDLAGAGTIKRADQRLLRVSFVVRRQTDGRFLALLRQAHEPVSASPHVFALGEVLELWRAAERRLAEVAQDDPEWALVADEVTALHEQYHLLYDTRRQDSGSENRTAL